MHRDPLARTEGRDDRRSAPGARGPRCVDEDKDVARPRSRSAAMPEPSCPTAGPRPRPRWARRPDPSSPPAAPVVIGGIASPTATAASTKLRPLGDRVVITPTPREEMTKSGIVLPDTAKEKPQEGTVLAVGP